MKTNRSAAFRAPWLGLVLLCFSFPLRADQFGLFTYQVLGATVVIADYPENTVGPVEIPAAIAGKPVTGIGWLAFSGCTGLTGVTIPNTVTFIDRGAFSGCAGLTSITIPASVTTISDYAFSDCSGLSSVSIPSSVTTIGEWAFAFCTGLTGVTFEQGLSTIGSGAFQACFGLTSVTIPSSVTRIGLWAFSGCSGLQSINVDAGNPQYASIEGVLFDASLTTLRLYPRGKAGPYTIPSSVTTFGAAGCEDLQCTDAFVDCTGLTSITIPSSVTTIGPAAFSRCTGLTSVTLQPGLSTIGDRMFSGCTGLTSITIPSSVTEIVGFSFERCTGLTRAVLLGDAPDFGPQVFDGTAPEFMLFFLSGRTGFSSPTWNGYPATRIDEATYPAASWLLAHGLWYDTDLQQDPDGDGVSLLMAYALDLDPNGNVQGSLSQPVLGADTLSLSFHATSPGVTYRAEISTDLQTWTTSSVTQSAPGADGRSTASVPRDSPNRFLRLVVGD